MNFNFKKSMGALLGFVGLVFPHMLLADSGKANTSRPGHSKSRPLITKNKQHPHSNRAQKKRTSAVLLRAHKLSLIKYHRAVQAYNKTMAQVEAGLHKKGRTSLERKFNARSLQVMATSKSKDAYINGQASRVSALDSVQFFEKRIQETDAFLKSLPRSATQGFQFGSIYGNQWLREENNGKLFKKINGIVDAVEKIAFKKLSAEKAKVIDLQHGLHKKLDVAYRMQKKNVEQKIANMDGDTLYVAAMKIVQDIDKATHGKAIRRELTEEGSSQAHFESKGSSSTGVRALGLFGQVKSAYRNESEYDAHGHAESKYQKEQLLLDADSYTIHVRNIHGRRTNSNAMTPVEARMLIGMILEAHQVIKALGKKDVHKAAVLNKWLEHSDVTFSVPLIRRMHTKKVTTKSFKIQMGHPHQDIIQLKNTGLVSPHFALRLERESQKPLEQMFGGSTLLD